ncbi:MAG TPA: phospholipase D-like domain-containing protein [Geminicoccaceae bacterium]|nr:phospholipase D-like domain-containing protein [Geminicoccaceae bacterium]
MLARDLNQFGRPGILSVRPGRLLRKGRITTTPAIVVNVQPERLREVAAALPKTVQGLPVDVRPAGVMKRMRSDDPARFVALGAARHELREPEFPGETFFDSRGRPLPQSPLSALLAAGSTKQRIEYTPAPGANLDEVTEDVTLVLHVSPDAGWPQLSTFLLGVQQELTVGMYDFTSAHILSTLGSALADKALTLTLDHPSRNPTADQSDEETRSELERQLGERLRAAWALTGPDRLAPAWIYPTAYHIKVAVRDQSSFWLSSGNWNNSNQPEIDLADPTAARRIAKGHDRDWHVIATGGSLPATFGRFLAHDFEVASAAEARRGPLALPGAFPPAREQVVPAGILAAARTPRELFPPTTISGRIRIQPLLTPDNYQPHVLALIRSAEHKLYMQTQYIHPSNRSGDEAHDELIAALGKLVRDGIDVRLICSEFETPDWIEKLLDAGVDPAVLRVQPRVHNKGIVVDGKGAMVSSQNWSADGTLRNRDAGLVIWDARAAAYFEQIFLHDWEHLARAGHPPVAHG